MSSASSQRPWTEEFSRSSLGPNVFFTKHWHPAFGPPTNPFEGTGIPAHTRVSHRDTTRRNAAFLDGGLIHRDPPYTLGLRGGWIIGYAAFRYICVLMELEPPRRLNGEAIVPSAEQLRQRLAQQLERERPGIEYRVEVFDTVSDGDDIRQIARELAQQDLWTAPDSGPVLFTVDRIAADLERLARLAFRDGEFVFVTWEAHDHCWVQVGTNERTHDAQVNLPALNHDAGAFLGIAAPYAARAFALTFVTEHYMDIALRCDLTSEHDRQQLAQDVLALAGSVASLHPDTEVTCSIRRG